MSALFPAKRLGKKTRIVAVSLTCLSLLAACGNRVDHDAVVAVGNGYGPVDAARDNQAAANVPGTTSAGAATGAVNPGVAAPGTAGGSTAPGAVAPGQPTPAGGSSGTSTQPGKPSAGTAGATGGNVTGSASTPCTKPLAPIVLGQTLASSGLVGAAISGLRTGLAVWAKDVNARGGVQCHPIQLIQLDDASDPARVSANWNTLVKDRGAVAVVGAGVPIAIAALRSSAERDRVPVVGGDITAVDWTQSPYLFPTGGAPLTSYDGALVEAAKAASGTDKTGIFYCVEASICTGLKNNFPKSSERAGAQVGPILAVSLTQPDFTSECQTMKAAGVNVLFFGLDGSASIRATRSCASLNYFPTIATGGIAVSAQAAADEGLRRNGTYLGSGIVPFTMTDLPAMVAFHDAMKRYAPTATEDQQGLLGWAAGKLFEAALSKVTDKARSGDVTTDLILNGLWQLKDEKLGGLSPGATFTKGAGAKYVDCYYPLKLSKDGFSAPLGSKPFCYGGSAKSSGGAASQPDRGQAVALAPSSQPESSRSGRRRPRPTED